MNTRGVGWGSHSSDHERRAVGGQSGKGHF